MFPYHDENETQRPAYVTMVLIALTCSRGCSSRAPAGAAAGDVGLQSRLIPAS